MSILKLVATRKPNASVATTLRPTSPALVVGGVPEKVRVVALNLSQIGSASPFASVAFRLK